MNTIKSRMTGIGITLLSLFTLGIIQTVQAQVPAAPTDLTATPVSNSEIDLTWTDNSTDEDGFEIWRADDITWTYQYLTQVGPDTTTYFRHRCFAGYYILLPDLGLQRLRLFRCFK